MNISPTIFREYDIRGLVESDLRPEAVAVIQRAYAEFLRRRNFNTAIVACDSRPYNHAVKEQVIEALRQSGINVIDVGVLTVPVFYFAQVYLKQTGGVMVTASHNPVGWSGFKCLVATLATATSVELKELQDIIAAGQFPSGAGGYERRDDVVEAYRQDVLSRVKISRPLKVVVDAGNETAGLINPSILRAAGLEVIEQCTTLGAPAPHEPNPSTVEALAHLRGKVREVGADLGVGYDADGDRLGVVDDAGEIIWSDRIAMVLARPILEEVPGTAVVFDVKCTQALADDVRAHGGRPVMWKTGYSYIRRKAGEVNAAFAVERSGHFFFWRDYYGYDDALFASLKLLEALSSQPKPLSQLMNDFPRYETSPVWHASCADEVKYTVVDRVVSYFKKTYGADRVIDINGARVQFDDGWGLVRASSNIPALVLVFEGQTVAARDRIEQLFRDVLKTYSEVGSHWKSG
jgi:phosphomannomutase/phosphoglucomutase